MSYNLTDFFTNKFMVDSEGQQHDIKSNIVLSITVLHNSTTCWNLKKSLSF